MKKLIDYLYQFQRRPVYAVYDIKTDFGFACMDKASIAIDLGFHVEKQVPFIMLYHIHLLQWRKCMIFPGIFLCRVAGRRESLAG